MVDNFNMCCGKDTEEVHKTLKDIQLGVLQGYAVIPIQTLLDATVQYEGSMKIINIIKAEIKMTDKSKE